MGRPEKLDQLTGLRFFAAAMIVFHHCNGQFGFAYGAWPRGLASGVSFFFVLSGFILAQVYPRLDTAAAVRSFLRARIARIWPAHVAAFLLAFWLLSLEWHTWPALANLLLLQAWSQDPAVYFGYNAPAWSLSDEWFFYLMFPLLILGWRRTWRAKLLFCGGVVAAFMTYYDFVPSTDGTHPLLNVYPLARLLEFALGIAVQSLWTSRIGQPAWSSRKATVLELGAILLCATYVRFAPDMWDFAAHLGAPAVGSWLSLSGTALPFAALILVVANGRGIFSRWLAHPGLVLLGEISFSIYLLHQIAIRYYQANIAPFSHLTGGAALGLYWLVVLLASYVMWAWLEMPMRRLIVHGRSIHGNAPMRSVWKSNAALSPRALIAVVSLCGILYGVNGGLAPAHDTARRPAYMVAAGTASLMDACWKGDARLVDLLVANGTDVNFRSANGITPLIAATTQQHAGIVAILVHAGAQADLPGSDGSTALMFAAWNGNATIVKTLLAAGADAHRKRNDGLDAIELARRGPHPGFAGTLAVLARTGKANPAVVGVDAGIMRTPTAKGTSVDSPDKDGSTPLLVAAWNGDTATVKRLLSLGANVNATRLDGYTPLISASMQGHDDVVEMLAAAGASTNATTTDGSTALMHAAWRGDRAMVELLLSLGADARLVNNDGYQAASLAAANGQKDIVDLLANRSKLAKPP